MSSAVTHFSAIELFNYCRKAGVYLSLKKDTISYQAIAEAITPEILEKIKYYKKELIALLEENPDHFNVRPLSANEKALWFMYRLDPSSNAYNMAYGVKLSKSARLNEASIKSAFNSLIQRHPILSCPYTEQGGEPVQWLNKPTIPTVDYIYKNNETINNINQRLREEADIPFVLESGKICRAVVLENNTEKGIEFYLLMVVHHIAADFVSFEKLRKDFLALLNQEALTPVDTAYNYRDWSARQYRYLQHTEAYQQDRQYWLNKLSDTPQLQLPTDFSHSKNQGSSGEEIDFTLSAEQAANLRESCKKLKVTPYSWWLSAFQWFMARLSGQDDFVIGTPSAGRLTQEHQQVVGYLVNPLVLRCQPKQKQAFKDWARDTNYAVRESLSHQRYPFASLVEELNIKRESGRNLLFQHMFTLNHERSELFDSSQIASELFAEQRGAAHELNLVIVDNRQQFKGKWRYNNSLYKRETIENIKQGFIYFVEQLINDDTKALADLSFNKSANQEQKSNTIKGHKLIPQHKTAWEAFLAQCERKPDNIALQFGQQKLSYAGLLKKVNVWSTILSPYINNSVNNTIGIYLNRSVDQIALMLATWDLGLAYVAMDTDWPDDRLDYISNNAAVSVVIGEGQHPKWLNKDTHWLDVSLSIDSTFPTDTSKKSTQVKAEQPAYIIYTSGSTGKPKGVVVTQRNLIHYATAMSERLALSATATMASLASNGADLGYTAIFGALLTGRCLRLLSEDLAKDADALADELANAPVDCLKIVPSHLNGLLLACERSSLLPAEVLITGGEALSPKLLELTWARKKSLRIFNHYGPTETTVGVIMSELKPSDIPTGGLLSHTTLPLGSPLANVVTRIVDKEGHTVIDGLPGELEIAGPTVAKGYINTTKGQSFYQQGKIRWYKTGDQVKASNGLLYFIGRSDFQVKIRGYRVELAEIEQAIKPYVNDISVIDYIDERDQCQLAAYLVASETQVNEAKKQLKKLLPNYMVPKRWLIIEALPLNSNGKVDRKKLLDSQTTDLSVVNLQSTNNVSTVSPQNAVERELLTIWQKLLNKPELTINDNFFESGGDSILGLQIISEAKKKNIIFTPKAIFEKQTVSELATIAETPTSLVEQKLVDIVKVLLNKPDISTRDNFFELGGDSILSLQLIAKAKSLGINITPKQIFEYPTIEALAEVSSINEENQKIENKTEASTALPKDPFSLTPIQHWFFEKNNTSQYKNHWNQSLLLNINTKFDLSVFKKSVASLVKAHAGLRLSFIQNNSEKAKEKWMQYYQEYSDGWLQQLVTIEDENINDLNLYKAQSVFNICAGPLIRFVWFTQTNQLLCTAHHLVIDAVAWQIVLSDLQKSYEAYQQGIDSPTLDKVDSHFHQWQLAIENYNKNITNQDGSNKELKKYWLNQIQQELPRTDKENTYVNSRHEITQLDKSLTQYLVHGCQQAYNTRIQEFLLSPLVNVLCHWQQLTEITIELEGHGREADSINTELDLSRSVGWFTSRYPQKISYQKDQGSQLITTKEQLRRIPQKGLSYGLTRYINSNSEPPVVWPEHSFISFNYLGKQNTNGPQDTMFSIENILCPGSRADENQRPHLIDINAAIVNDCLVIDWCFPKNNPAYKKVPDIAKAYQSALTEMILLCSNSGYGRATAADFPEANISDKEFLDLLVELDD